MLENRHAMWQSKATPWRHVPLAKAHDPQGTCISHMDELMNSKDAGVLTKEHGIWVALLIC